MFVDLSFFEVEEGHQRSFEREFGTIVKRASETNGCVTSELIRMDEDYHYVWVERWENREEHNNFNEILFGQLLPDLPDIGRYASRLVDRDAEGYVVI